MTGGNKKSISKRSKYLLFIGFFFFINPVPLGFDFIPDVFGCIFVYFGLAQLAYFDGAIEGAMKYMLYLLAVEAVRLFSMDMILSAEISSNRMLAVTAFTVVEAIIYVLMFRQLFSGINYFAMRNDCNKALAKCDNTAFLTYLSFFARLAATLIPELFALIELEVNVVTDFDTVDTINNIVAAKPILVVLLSLVALVMGVAWYISTVKLFGLIHSEGGEELDRRYFANFLSRPEMVRPKKLKAASAAVYISLVFAVDISFDGVRILPASVMFLGLFAACFFFKYFRGFSTVKKLAIPAFILFFISERFKAHFVPYGAVKIYETELWIVAVNAVIAILSAVLGMLCIRMFLKELRELSLIDLEGENISTKKAWTAYCVTVVLWASGYVVPYFYATFASARLLSACVFIWQTARLLTAMNENLAEKTALYGTVQR